MFTSLADLTLPYPQSYTLSQSGPVPVQSQTPDDLTGPRICLLVGVPDQFPPEGVWTYDTFPLSVVVCCECNGEEAILTDLEGIPAATEVSVLDVPLLLLFLLFGPEDVSYCSWQCLLEPAQLLDVLIQHGVGP